jgi:hypothetical protein
MATTLALSWSAFLGFALLLHYCKEVHAYHLVPPYSRKKRPHKFTNNPPGDKDYKFPLYHVEDVTHQMLIEKIWYMNLNVASDVEAYVKGHVVVPGLSTIRC